MITKEEILPFYMSLIITIMLQITNLFCTLASFMGMIFTSWKFNYSSVQTAIGYSLFLICFIIWLSELIIEDEKQFKKKLKKCISQRSKY